MRIHEIITESNEHREVETKHIPPELNGGSIEITEDSSDEYPITAYSYSYFNNKITRTGPVLRCECA